MSVHRMASPLAFPDIRTAMLLALAVILAGCETTQPSENEFLTTHDDDIEVRPETRGLQLPLPNGNLIKVLVSQDEQGELHVDGLVEYRKAKNRGIASVSGLSTASIPEIYYALAEPDAETPDFLALDRYPEPTRPQGWARDIILTGGPVQIHNCFETDLNWDAFRQEVIDQGYPLVFLSEADGPASKPNHWEKHDIGSILEEPWYEFRGGVNGSTALYVSVARCQGNTTVWGNPPYLSVSRKPAGEGGTFGNVLWQSLPEAGDQATYITPESELGTESDYRVWLGESDLSSKFHIGAAWLKPSDTLGPNP